MIRAGGIVFPKSRGPGSCSARPCWTVGGNTGPASRIWIATSSHSLWRRGMRGLIPPLERPSPLSPRLLGRDRPSRLERRPSPLVGERESGQSGEGEVDLGGLELRRQEKDG